MTEHLVYDSLGDGNCLFNSAVIDIAQDLRTKASEDKWLALLAKPEHKRHFVKLINEARLKDQKLSKDDSFPKVFVTKTSKEEVFNQFKALFTKHYDISNDNSRYELQRLISPILRTMIFTAAQNESLKVRDIANRRVTLQSLMNTYFEDALEDSILRYVALDGQIKGSQAFESFSPLGKELDKLFKRVNLEKLNDQCNRFDALKTRLVSALEEANRHIAEDLDEVNPALRAQTLALKVKKMLDTNELNIEPSLKKKVARLYNGISNKVLKKPRTKGQKDKIDAIANSLTALILDYEENKRVGFAKAELHKRLAPKIAKLNQWFDETGRDLYFNHPKKGLINNGVWVNNIGLELMSSLFGITCLQKFVSDSEDREGFNIYPENAIWQVFKRFNTFDKSGIESTVNDTDLVIHLSHTGAGHWEACLPLTGPLKKSVEAQVNSSKHQKVMTTHKQSLPLHQATGQINSILVGFGVSGLTAAAGILALQAAPVFVAATCVITFIMSMLASDAYQQRYSGYKQPVALPPKLDAMDEASQDKTNTREAQMTEHQLENDLDSREEPKASPAIVTQYDKSKSAVNDSSSTPEEEPEPTTPSLAKKSATAK